MRARRDGGGDLGKVQRHPFGVAVGQNERCALALGWTDGAVDGRRCCATIKVRVCDNQGENGFSGLS